MGKNLGRQVALIVVVLLVFVYGIIGIPKNTGKGIGDAFAQSVANNIKLGLDLKGGIHLVLVAHVNEAIASATDRDAQRIQAALQAASVVGPTVAKLDAAHPESISITGIPPAQESTVRSTVSGSDYAVYDVAAQPDGSLKLTMKPSAVKDLENHTLDLCIETIRARIDKLGVSEPTIQRYGLGDNEILVELPGVDDPGRVEGLINSTAKLEIHAVADGASTAGYEDQASAVQAMGGALPPTDYLVQGKAFAGSPTRWFVLERTSQVAGTDFRDAQPSTDINGRPNIKFTLTTEAGDRFYQYTDAHKQGGPTPGSMAIVLSDQVQEVASIQSGIRDSGELTGAFTKQAAEDLSLMLRTGALPASISFLETRTVGPSLGASSVRQGVIAAVAGMAAVMIFMLIYYKGSGINADLALLLNLLILLGFMGFSHATLTLPGIAGVILTIGMGVDSNVLIFERIREELRAGKSAAAAVKEGFDHAWITIVDTHVTTIVSAAILFLFGTGPVKGFAVTLTFGLLANLFTAVYVSRLIFDWHLEGKERNAPLSI
jgi:preprotein translocase subunit SecD